MAETIRNTIGELRREHYMTQQELAENVGVTRQTIIAMEKGNYIPSVLLAMKVAQVFEVDVEKLFSVECI